MSKIDRRENYLEFASLNNRLNLKWIMFQPKVFSSNLKPVLRPNLLHVFWSNLSPVFSGRIFTCYSSQIFYMFFRSNFSRIFLQLHPDCVTTPISDSFDSLPRTLGPSLRRRIRLRQLSRRFQTQDRRF
jgi:hypothetical protein